MREYKGKTSMYLISLFIAYNVLPLLFFFNGRQMPFHLFWVIVWVIYYSSNIIWIPILLKNKVSLYDDHFVLSYGLSTTTVYINDITCIERSSDPIQSTPLSTDRVHIQTNENDLLISLMDIDEFINDVNLLR